MEAAMCNSAMNNYSNEMSSSGEQSPIALTPAGTPSLQSAPKYGTLIPNRIFVGGISGNATEAELKQFFTQFGAVKDAKIIMDRAGVSKGYGFVTFESQEEAEKIIKKENENFMFKDRKLNIGPAIKKQAYPQPSLSPTSAVFYTNGAVPYTFQNGVAVFGADGSYTTLPQQYAGVTMMPQYAVQPSYYHTSPTAATTPTHWAGGSAAAATASQWRWAPQSPATPTAVSAAQYLYHPSMAQSASGLHHDGATLMYTQPSMATAQGASYATASDLAEASMMEAAPAEGSFTMAAHGQYADRNTQQQQQQTPAHRSSSTTASSCSSSSPAKMMSSPHRYPYAMPMTPGATPRSYASKVLQYSNPRMVTKTINGTPIKVLCREGSTSADCPLTPPPTPHLEAAQS